MNVNEIDCHYTKEHDLAARYLNGGLSRPEAEAFESHFMDCPRCWDEIESAGELREAFGHPYAEVKSTAARRSPRGDLWTLLAAAAVVAIMAIGLGRLGQPLQSLPEARVARGANRDTLELTVRPGSPGSVILQWPPHPGARTYLVEVLRSDRIPVLKSETSDTKLSLDVSALPPSPTGVSFIARVKALDIMRQVVAESELRSISSR